VNKTEQTIIKMPYGSVPVLAEEFKTSRPTVLRALNGETDTFLGRKIRKRANEILGELEYSPQETNQ